MGGGDGCTAVDMYLMSLNCTRKKDSDGKSVLWNERERDGTHGGALMREGCHNALFAVTWGGSEGTDSSSPSRDSVGVYGCEGASGNLQLRRWPDSSSGSL